jgi:hypothetical protein
MESIVIIERSRDRIRVNCVPKVRTNQILKVFSTLVPLLLWLTSTIVLISNNSSDSCFIGKRKAVDWGEPETEKKGASQKFGHEEKV